ncbi:MAG: acylneuraminate cytidylyltransferase family protein [Candidatus Omnitrophica bacterium]|nr:acylneuraminate cytidylyltransferase family protein [Candidatus Omnitrophota bacterium]
MSDAEQGLLAVIPARGGSKGLPGKNIRPFLGLPLIAHSILFAKMCPEIDRCVVSTDVQEIAEVAKRFGAETPCSRPSELAQDDTPLWMVVQHALAFVEKEERRFYKEILLLDPTSPAREPLDVTVALRKLRESPEADGIIGVSEPEFNPIWHCVVERDGCMAQLIESGGQFTRRQDVPTVYRINGSIYLWRAAFVRVHQGSWQRGGRYLLHEIPEIRAMSIDDAKQFARAEAMVRSGLITLPWLSEAVRV